MSNHRDPLEDLVDKPVLINEVGKALFGKLKGYNETHLELCPYAYIGLVSWGSEKTFEPVKLGETITSPTVKYHGREPYLVLRTQANNILPFKLRPGAFYAGDQQIIKDIQSE